MVDSENILTTQITDDIRVSSAAWFTGAHFGDYTQIETWIFSNNSDIESTQIIHGTYSGHGEIPELYRARAIKAHEHIAKNLKEKFKCK